MLIYIFAEHYPNVYKPYLDTQFAHFLSAGHELGIFAGGKYVSTLHDEVRRYRLDEMTGYFPTTLRTLPRLAFPLFTQVLGSPRTTWNEIRNGAATPERRVKDTLLRVARMLLLPRRVPDLCLIHNLTTAAMVDFLADHYPGSRVVMYFHGGEVGGARPLSLGESRRVFDSVHLVITNTEYSRNLAIERGCPPGKTLVLPVGFNLEDYVPEPNREYRAGGVLHLVSVGRMGAEKGYLYALEALSQLVKNGRKDLRYTIVGSGQEAQRIKKFVKEQELTEYVTLAGEQDKLGVISHLQQADVLILPSIETATWAETQACVVQEAMLMRLLVITTQAGGVPESIPDAMRRFSVPARDAGAISRALQDILSLAQSEIRRLGAEGRGFVVERYDIDRINRELLSRALGVDRGASERR